MWQRLALLLLWALHLAPPALAQTVDDEFDGDSLNTKFWCACQIDPKNGPIEFLADPSEGGEGILRITVDGDSVGGNKCRRTSRIVNVPPRRSWRGWGCWVAFNGPQRPCQSCRRRSGRALVTPALPLFAVGPRQFSYCTDEVELPRASQPRGG